MFTKLVPKPYLVKLYFYTFKRFLLYHNLGIAQKVSPIMTLEPFGQNCEFIQMLNIKLMKPLSDSEFNSQVSLYESFESIKIKSNLYGVGTL